MSMEQEIADFWSRKVYVSYGSDMRPWDEKYNRDTDPRYNKALPRVPIDTNKDGRYRGTFITFQETRMSVETRTLLQKLQAENAQLAADRIERRGHDEMLGGESEEHRELNRRRDKYGVPYKN